MKEIELENFKSFGRHLRLPLLPGYTAITGPNGSGKSNLSDAVLFVLGPKSSKVIRAGKLTDLVYKGGNERKAADYCRVSLVFDNTDGTIPLDNDEVRLTRYVGLSPSVEGGYNSYFYINGRKATLAAFDALLANARISAEGYNIVQQGDVGRVVEMSPAERRRVLEGMAGISRFDEDINEAAAEKRVVEENLGRIEIILEEIARQMRQLEKDRQAALRYRELKEEVERARAQYARKEVQILRQQVASLRHQTEKHRAEGERLEAQRDDLRASLEAAGRRLEELEVEVANRGGEEFQLLKEKLDNLRIERARAQDGIERCKEEARQLKGQATGLRKELDRLTRAVESLRSAREEAQRGLDEVQGSLKGVDEDISKLEEEAARSDARVLDLQKALVGLDKEATGAEERLSETTLQRDLLKQRLSSLEEEVAQLEEERKAREFEVQDGEWQLKEFSVEGKEESKELARLKEKYGSAEAELTELRKQSAELDMALKSLSREYSHLKAEAEAADNVQRGYTRAVSAILDARDRGHLTGVKGTIAELAMVETKYETALNVAAGSRMQAIVVEDDGVAAEAIELLMSKKLGRATFLPLNKMLPGRPRGRALLAVRESVGFAIDLVAFEEEYRNAFWYVFGDTVVVEDLAQARRLMGGVRLVTLDGQLVEASGAMVGGQAYEVVLKFGQASSSRLQEVSEKLRRVSDELARVSKRIRELQEQATGMEKEIRQLQTGDERRKTRAESLRVRVKEAEARLETVRASLNTRLERRDEALREQQSLESEWESAEKAYRGLQAKRETRRKELAETTPQSLAVKLRECQSEKVSLVSTLNELASRVETQGNQLSLQEERRKEVETRLAEAERGESETQKKREELEGKLASIEEELLGLHKMEDRLLAGMKEIHEERDRAFKDKTEMEAKLQKVGDRLDTTRDFLLSLEAQESSLKERLVDAEAQVGNGDVGDDLPPMEEIRATILRTEKGLESIGAVNLRALEDYESQQSRHQELLEELTRLKNERKNLLKLVEELEARKKEGLLRVYTAIKGNFAQIYAELSEGGEAELSLESEENPFEGGLIVRARPLNKRFLRLEALSGGEKSLVSMAFIFALQEYDPSPFYFLDEVDQNLDAVNAERIAKMIGTNSASAQFIQISLRKVSLKEANHIIGVTMGGRGVSEVVMKVNLDEVVEEVPKEEVAA